MIKELINLAENKKQKEKIIRWVNKYMVEMSTSEIITKQEQEASKSNNNKLRVEALKTRLLSGVKEHITIETNTSVRQIILKMKITLFRKG